jgi:predicted dehydrogenase
MLEIYGTRGSISVSDGKLRIKLLYPPFEKLEHKKSAGNLYKPQLEHFSRCVDGKEETITPGIAGLRNIQIITAAYESARTGKAVSISTH